MRSIARNAMSDTGSAWRNRSLNSMQSTITTSGPGRAGPERAAAGGLGGRRPGRAPLHLHGPIDDLARTLDRESIAVARDRHHAQVHLGREPAVEPDLLLAEVQALRQRAVVEVR